jgi:hypothetical protein
MAELKIGFPDGWVTNDREKACGIRHDGPVEQGLVVVEQVREIDVAIKVSRLVTELHHQAA